MLDRYDDCSTCSLSAFASPADNVAADVETPLVSLEEGIYAKLEYHRPTGSYKDRMAFYCLDTARKEGRLLTDAHTIIAPSSGNTSSAVACYCKENGYRCIVVVPKKCSSEKRDNARRYGAEVVEAPSEYREYARQMYRDARTVDPGVFLFDQYTDANNAASYEHTLGPELANQIEHLGINSFTLVAAASTGGALIGISRYLKERFSRTMTVRIVLAEPASPDTTIVPGATTLGRIALPGLDDLIDASVAVEDDKTLDTWYTYGQSHSVGCSGALAITAARRIPSLPWAADYPPTRLCIVADSARNYSLQFTSLLAERGTCFGIQS